MYKVHESPQPPYGRLLRVSVMFELHSFIIIVPLCSTSHEDCKTRGENLQKKIEKENFLRPLVKTIRKGPNAVCDFENFRPIPNFPLTPRTNVLKGLKYDFSDL